MLLGEMLHTGVVRTSLEAQTKVEAIEELIDLLVQAHELPILLRDHVVEVVMAREKSMSTGMEHGIALPHGATDRVDGIIAALGISKEGIPFDSLDGRPARLIVLLVLPKNKFQAHVRTLAGIAHLMSDASFRDSLALARDVEMVLRLIERAEEQQVFSEYRTKP